MLTLKRDTTILVVEDEPEVRSYLELSLRCHGMRVESAEDGDEALQLLEREGHSISAVLLDVAMPGRDGLSTLRQMQALYRDLPVIMLSGASSTATVVDAIKTGATDFLVKPIDHSELSAAIQNALRSGGQSRPVPPPAPRSRPSQNDDSVNCFMYGGWLKKIDSFLSAVGACDAPVLIQGETGVGKEVVAQLLHSRSPRSDRPFLKLNCAALPSELIESELFGFEKGAFTGAFKNKPGKFDQADNGTLMLDEIGDMDFKLQAKLLQVLQDQKFERLGGSSTVKVNVRVIAATHCDLEAAITNDRFREDLYHRLNVISIHVPPLRERQDEILPLAEFFLQKHSTNGDVPEIPPVLRQALLAFRWPGNIRELENFMRRYLVLRSPQLALDELRMRTAKNSSRAQSAAPAPAPVPAPVRTAPTSLDKVNEAQRQIESQVIVEALNRTHWNRKQAAGILGVEYKALLYKMKKLGIDDAPPEEDSSWTAGAPDALERSA